MTYRVKLIVPCRDVHYFYATSIEEAEALRDDLYDQLAGVDCEVFLYAETTHGHVRIDSGEHVKRDDTPDPLVSADPSGGVKLTYPDGYVFAMNGPDWALSAINDVARATGEGHA